MATGTGRDPKQQRRLARKIEEYQTDRGMPVKVYVKRAVDETSPAPPTDGPLVYYFRCLVGDQWVTYVVIITDGLRAVLRAKGTQDDSIVRVALKYVKNEIGRGNLTDGTELEFGPLQEGLFPKQ